MTAQTKIAIADIPVSVWEEIHNKIAMKVWTNKSYGVASTVLDAAIKYGYYDPSKHKIYYEDANPYFDPNKFFDGINKRLEEALKPVNYKWDELVKDLEKIRNIVDNAEIHAVNSVPFDSSYLDDEIRDMVQDHQFFSEDDFEDFVKAFYDYTTTVKENKIYSIEDLDELKDDLEEYVCENPEPYVAYTPLETEPYFVNINIMPSQPDNFNSEGDEGRRALSLLCNFINKYTEYELDGPMGIDNEIDEHDEKLIRENELWAPLDELFESQGYVYSDLLDDKKVENSCFLRSVMDNLNEHVSLPFVSYLTTIELKDLYNLFRFDPTTISAAAKEAHKNGEISDEDYEAENYTVALSLSRKVSTYFFDPAHGSGSCDINIEKPVKVSIKLKDLLYPYRFAVQLNDDRSRCYGYSPFSVYGDDGSDTKAEITVKSC